MPSRAKPLDEVNRPRVREGSQANATLPELAFARDGPPRASGKESRRGATEQQSQLHEMNRHARLAATQLDATRRHGVCVR